MADLTSPRLIIFKGVLFFLLGLMSGTGLLLIAPRVDVAALLCVSIWAFCRCYYFAFYVIQHYVDPQFRYAGLGDFAAAWFRGRIRLDVPAPADKSRHATDVDEMD